MRLDPHELAISHLVVESVSSVLAQAPLFELGVRNDNLICAQGLDVSRAESLGNVLQSSLRLATRDPSYDNKFQGCTPVEPETDADDDACAP